jgi:hydroxyacylglutathione hydrolase
MNHDPLQVLPILSLKDNYIWGIVHPNQAECVIVDPGTAKPVFDFLANHALKLTGILVTHHHWDHTGGIAEILSRLTIPVFGPVRESVPECKYPLKDNDVIDLLKTSFRALAIPGHTLDHLAYYRHKLLFTGDTLFTGGCGRLFEGSAAQMLASLDKLAKLPDDTLIYCGHEYTEKNLQFATLVEAENQQLQQRVQITKILRGKNLPTVPATLLLEKQTNPFLRTENTSVIKAAESYAGKKLTNRLEVFTVLRQWKNNF